MSRSSSRRLTLSVVTAALLLAALASCNRKTVYDHYEHTPITGWDKSDTLCFPVNAIGQSGTYREEVGLRINGYYPFRSLSLVIEQVLMPTGYVRHDTLSCTLIDHDGHVKGDGVGSYQYLFHLNSMQLNPGDSLHVSIRHNMKRETLPGIADVGFRLRRE